MEGNHVECLPHQKREYGKFKSTVGLTPLEQTGLTPVVSHDSCALAFVLAWPEPTPGDEHVLLICELSYENKAIVTGNLRCCARPQSFAVRLWEVSSMCLFDP